MANHLDETLQALADPTRRAMIELLRGGPRRAGEIAAAFPARGPTISRHLRVLRTSGLIEAMGMPEDARVRLYQLRPQPFAELGEWVDQVQSFWSAKLGAFKTHIERQQDRGEQ